MILAAVVSAVPPLILRAVIDTAIPDKDRQLVALLAAGAVFLALFNAGLSLVQRYYSAGIGEGLIFDMRTALFDHVQHQPLSFFTRTQTGSLMSRMNNDVIGAQQAVTNTLGTVFSNVVTVVVTLAFMLALEWRLTLLTLVILPLFIIPAKRMGPTLQRLTRESMQLNASMNNTIAERFNVGGALVVKLFGRHRQESDTFSDRAGRVRDIGVQTAMYSRVLFVALGLVAAIGTAIVYFVGGNLAISGTIGVGTIAAFTVYVSQIYQPLTQLANARVDVLTALGVVRARVRGPRLPAAHHRPHRRLRPGRAGRPGGVRPRVVPPPVRRRCRRSRRWRKPAPPPTPTRATGSSATSASPWPRASWSLWSDRRARARRPARCSSRASTT